MRDLQIRAVTFDAGNTLLYPEPAPPVLYAEALSRHGRAVKPDEVAPVFRDAWVEMQARTVPGQDRYGLTPGGERAWWGELLQEVLRRLEHDAPWQQLLDELYAAFARTEVWRVYPEVVATLEAARGAGLALAVISNWDRRLPDILAGLGLTPYFAGITVSSLEGIEKPAPEIFRRTVARLGVAPQHALHCGDSPLEDYLGAQAVGMTALLVDRRGLFVGEGFRRVDRLDAILALIGA